MTRESPQSPLELLQGWREAQEGSHEGLLGHVPSRPERASGSPVSLSWSPPDLWQQCQGLDRVIAGLNDGRTSVTLGSELLGSIRNALVPAILVFVADEWPDETLFSLGFRRLARFPHDSLPCKAFEYQLTRYNHKRSWNNPRFWANPENFGKYWW